MHLLAWQQACWQVLLVRSSTAPTSRKTMYDLSERQNYQSGDISFQPELAAPHLPSYKRSVHSESPNINTNTPFPQVFYLTPLVAGRSYTTYALLWGWQQCQSAIVLIFTSRLPRVAFEYGHNL